MKATVKKTFSMSGVNFNAGEVGEFTEDLISRIPDYLEPEKLGIKNIDSPPENKMIQESKKEVEKKTKKGGRSK